jgi:hypothetical protein
MYCNVSISLKSISLRRNETQFWIQVFYSSWKFAFPCVTPSRRIDKMDMAYSFYLRTSV